MSELDLGPYTPEYGPPVARPVGFPCSLCGGLVSNRRTHTEYHQGFGEVVEVLRMLAQRSSPPQPPEGLPPPTPEQALWMVSMAPEPADGSSGGESDPRSR